MKILKIETQKNGSHLNQSIDGNMLLPDGWAVIPDDMELENFPFGEVETEEIDGVMTVTKWTAGTIPEPKPMPEPESSTDEVLNALLGVE